MSPTPLDPASGASWSVERTPIACPDPFMKPLPESPGMPGDAVATSWLHPLPAFCTTTPCFGLSWLTPPRSSELPYEYTLDPRPPTDPTPVGPPQNGTEGLTLPTSAGSSFTSARSLNWQVSASLSPFACMVSHEL